MAMTTRFCTRCDTDVQDAGGYCLLGHPLALKPLDASLSDLRAEIDQAFEDARLEVASVASGNEITEPMRIVSRAPAPPRPPAPSHPRRVGPPPPPPPRALRPVVVEPATPAAPQNPTPVEREVPLEPAAQAVPVVEEISEVPVAFVPEVPEAPVAFVPQAPKAPVAPCVPEVSPPEAAPFVHEEAVAPVAPYDPDSIAPDSVPSESTPEFPDEGEILARKFPVWQELEEASPIIGDPIGAFAPPPHMDWGPEKSTNKLLKRRPSRTRKTKRVE